MLFLLMKQIWLSYKICNPSPTPFNVFSFRQIVLPLDGEKKEPYSKKQAYALNAVQNFNNGLSNI